jgi:hypothetical protein
MTLKSIKEDLQASTLRAVSGLLGKLEYLSGLREEDGSYSHWGLSRVHGEAATQRALSEAHRSVVSRILRTPVRSLLTDVRDSSVQKKMARGEFLEELKGRDGQLVPPHPSAGASRHLNSVLRALASLVKNRR